MMYDELVKRLRKSKNEQCYIGCFGNCGYCEIDDELEQAADAIEELEKEVQNWKITAGEEASGLEHWFENYQKDIPRWIPVTEKLPKPHKEVYVTDCEYIERANLLDEVFPGDQPCWSYSGIGEITHWCEKLPLPELPKEET